MINKGEDGVYTLAYPINAESKFPLFDPAEDTGKTLNLHRRVKVRD